MTETNEPFVSPDYGQLETKYLEYMADKAEFAADSLRHQALRVTFSLRYSPNPETRERGQKLYQEMMSRPHQQGETITGRLTIEPPASDHIDGLLRESLEKLKAREDALLIELGERAYSELLEGRRDGDPR